MESSTSLICYPLPEFPIHGNYIWPQRNGNIKESPGHNVTYIRSCINERPGTGNMVGKTGLMKGCHMVYSQNIHIVTLEAEHITSQIDLVGEFVLRSTRHQTRFVNLCWWTTGITRALWKLISSHKNEHSSLVMSLSEYCAAKSHFSSVDW